MIMNDDDEICYGTGDVGMTKVFNSTKQNEMLSMPP